MNLIRHLLLDPYLKIRFEWIYIHFEIGIHTLLNTLPIPCHLSLEISSRRSVPYTIFSDHPIRSLFLLESLNQMVGRPQPAMLKFLLLFNITHGLENRSACVLKTLGDLYSR